MEFLFRYKSRMITFLLGNSFVEKDSMLFLFKLYVILDIGFCSSQGEQRGRHTTHLRIQ
jgi:putative ribosome biogenesis GTPase RsgA